MFTNLANELGDCDLFYRISTVSPHLPAIVHIAAPINLHLHIRRRRARTRGTVRHPNEAVALLRTVHAIARCDVVERKALTDLRLRGLKAQQ